MRKIFIKLIVVLFFFIFFETVNAETFTLNDLVDKINGYDYSKINSGNFSAIIEDGKLVFKASKDDLTENLTTFEFENDLLSKYIKIDVDQENALSEAMAFIFAYNLIIYSVADMHGYTSREVDLYLKKDANIDTDGYEIKPNETGEILVKIDINKFNLNIVYIDAPKPVVKIGEVTSNSIMVEAEADVEDETEIDFYRSENGTDYKYIFSSKAYSGSTTSFSSLDDLEPGKTYYYKAVVAKSNNYSEVVTATTLIDDNHDNADVDKIPEDTDKTLDEIPQTGFVNSIVGCLFLLSIIITISICLNKKNKLNRI